MKQKTAPPRRMLNAALVALLFAVPLLGAWTNAAEAATKKQIDKALLVNQSNRFLVLPPGKSVTVWFDFQNTGTSTWTSADPHPVGLNTDDPMRRTSKFQFRGWRATWRPTRVQQKSVKPGEVGRFRFTLKAPNKPGIWREKFAVVRDTATRVPGGDVEFVIVVGKQGDAGAVYRAAAKQSKLSLWVRPGERIRRSLDFRNVGYATWRKDGYAPVSLEQGRAGQVMIASTGAFGQASSQRIAKAAGRREWTSAVLDVIAPTTPGTYTEIFGLNGPFGVMPGSEVTVELIVSEQPAPILAAEPIVRVGVFAPTKPVEMTASGPYDVRNVNTGELAASLTGGAVATVSYDPANASYTLTTPSGTQTSASPYRFLPVAPGSLLEVVSFSNKREVTVDGQTTIVNDNVFRGEIEVRYATATQKLWVINELPMEQYLAGLAETTNRAPFEFVKTLVTAARTYALYHQLRATKHADEFYHLNSTTDQLYRGYRYEQRHPNIGQAAAATRGQAATHPSMVSEKNVVGAIVAAYSSCTDGRTRSYEERWGGPPGLYPYLVSVPDPNGICTNTRWLQGLDGNHMVGMSAQGALRTVVNEGVSYDTILKYYYTGIAISQAYP